MSEIPKFVQSRLSRPVPTSHPDADVLTAFVERALPESERTKVLEHLAGCADCRDVVVLAQPEPAGPTQTVLVPHKRGLLRWPVMRWVAVAACLVIGAAVSLQVLNAPRLAHMSVENRAEAPPVAKVSSGPKPARDEVKEEKAQEELASVSHEHSDLSRAQASLANEKLAGKAVPAEEGKVAVLDRKARYGGYSQQKVPAPTDNLIAKAKPGEPGRADYDKNYSYQGYSNAAPPASAGAAAGRVASLPPSAPAPVQGVVVGGRLAEAEADTRRKELALDKSAVAARKGDAGASNKAESSIALAVPGAKDEKASVDTAVLSGTGNQNQPAPAPTTAPAVAQLPVMGRSTTDLTPAQTSQSVEVTAASPNVQSEVATPSTLQITGMSRAPAILSRWRLGKDHQLERFTVADSKWQSTNLDGQPELHALFFSGPNVWVGGKGGVLMHSADAGEHWQRVTASHDGTVVTDDIVAIDFKDFQHGHFKTDKKKVWITSNGGQTWAPK